MNYQACIVLLLLKTFVQSDFQEWLKPEPITETYDFIIVGSGSAGSVIANRLSEVPHWNILLLEVGREADLLTEVPFVASVLQFTDYNWNYLMEYQPGVAQACNQRRMPWPRGRALGGTSVINYMLYTRGSRFYYDKWASQGNPGWSYEEVLPYFIKSENAGLNNADYKFHGTDGYLSVENPYRSKITDGFMQGMNELGLPTIDYNSNNSIGVSALHATLSKGRRDTVAKAFLAPVKHRTNLRILTKALVTKILINSNKIAYGVEYERFGQKHKVEARKEVILSAGAISSPQLLMLSGVGPAEHLQELGIPVLKNLRVGQNLQDHLTYLGLTFETSQHVTLDLADVLKPSALFDFVMSGTGPLTCLTGAEALAYVKTSQSTETVDMPDMEIILLSVSLATDYGISIRNGMGITDEVFTAVYGSLLNKHSFMILPMFLSPKSKGYIKLKTTNPWDYPLLYGNFFTDPQNHDMKSFVAAIRIVQELGSTKAFRKYNATFNTNRVPGCIQHPYDSDAYWKCCLTYLAQTLHHQVGTAKMGPQHDREAVVDHELKVYGIQKLRVADTSVIPFALGAHTNVPSIMIGEKASDMIKHSWKDYL